MHLRVVLVVKQGKMYMTNTNAMEKLACVAGVSKNLRVENETKREGGELSKGNACNQSNMPHSLVVSHENQ